MTYLFAGKEKAAERLKKINKLFFPATKEFLLANAPKRVNLLVDLGCGPGYTTRALSSVVDADEYLGLDSSEYFIERAKGSCKDDPRISYRVHDVTRTPFTQEKADIIYLRFLLTHLHDPRRLVLDWGTQLTHGGLLFIEETEAIKTEVPVFQEYIGIVEALIKSNGNILFIGKTLDEWEYEGELKKRYSEIVKVPATTKQTAEIFLLNVPSYKEREFIKENHYDSVLRIESELGQLVEKGDDRETIEWEIRQVCLEKI